MKFTFGNWGLGVYICEDMKQMNAAIQAQHNGPYILQVWLMWCRVRIFVQSISLQLSFHSVSSIIYFVYATFKMLAC